jgi:homoaconitate hydratase
MSQTITEKIVQAHAVDLPPGHEVRAADMVTIRPRHVMTHDNTSAVLSKFRAIGAHHVANPAQPVFTLDHNVQDSSPANLAKYAAIESGRIRVVIVTGSLVARWSECSPGRD